MTRRPHPGKVRFLGAAGETAPAHACAHLIQQPWRLTVHAGCRSPNYVGDFQSDVSNRHKHCEIKGWV
jgi:hypothetical protein